MRPLMTIGHSSLEPEIFVQILKKFGIEILADVRSVPYSRFANAFNKESLSKFLYESDIGYVYVGNLIGGQFDSKFFDKSGNLDTEKLFKNNKFNQGIRQILDLAINFNVCLMCTEANPVRCHRFGVISQFLSLNFSEVEISHIASDCGCEFALIAQKELEDEILKKFCSKDGLNLYDEKDELVSAYMQLNKVVSKHTNAM